MIQSMTGFGKACIELPGKKINIEIKSLNGKQLDINARIPSLYREKELEIRGILSKVIERGKVDLYIYVDYLDKTISSTISSVAVESYFGQIKTISEHLNISMPQDWFSVILRLPETIKTETGELGDEEWEYLKEGLEIALEAFVQFRKQEGAMLEDVLLKNIRRIEALLSEVDNYESERIEKIKSKILESQKKIESVSFDTNRFEQELIYYIEKLDVNEEKSRLKNHLDYFVQTMNEDDSQGRKLGFIAQEIGREINTLGSKANHAEMQKLVVQMKDELEQIKEQILNVL